ncbi:MAG: hypothetical protein HY719_03945 [Planctomycetes bacterium]|nr:hypothetical protein [Planctomycetota bacterium]
MPRPITADPPRRGASRAFAALALALWLSFVFPALGSSSPPTSFVHEQDPLATLGRVAVAVGFHGPEQRVARWLGGLLEVLGFDVQAPPPVRDADTLFPLSPAPGDLDARVARAVEDQLRERGYSPRPITVPAENGEARARDLCAAAAAQGADLLLLVRYSVALEWSIPRDDLPATRQSHERVDSKYGVMILPSAAAFDPATARRAWGFEEFRPDAVTATTRYAETLPRPPEERARLAPLFDRVAKKVAPHFLLPPGARDFHEFPRCQATPTLDWPNPPPAAAVGPAPGDDLDADLARLFGTPRPPSASGGAGEPTPAHAQQMLQVEMIVSVEGATPPQAAKFREILANVGVRPESDAKDATLLLAEMSRDQVTHMLGDARSAGVPLTTRATGVQRNRGVAVVEFRFPAAAAGAAPPPGGK